MPLFIAVLLIAAPLLAASDAKPPTVPRGVTVTGTTQGSVSLQWLESSDFKGGSGVQGYGVVRDGIQVGFTPAVTYTDSTAGSGTTYRYAVFARDNAGNTSVTSVPVIVTTPGSACQALPGTPADLNVSGVSSSTVSLSWSAVSPPAPGCAVTYNVYRDGGAIASGLSTTTYTAAGLEPAKSYTFTVSAQDSFGTSPLSGEAIATTAPAGSELPGFPARVVAPYVDVLLWPTPSLSAMATDSGARFFSTGFIVAGSGCQATWGRRYSMADGFLKDDIAALRRMKGDVIVSFGGAAGTELALACSSVAALQTQYQAVIDTYNLTRVDFDIEGKSLANAAANDLRAKAIKGLQDAASAAGKSLFVQFTLPVMPEGLTADGLSLLRNARDNGVSIGVVNVMAMDYGRSYNPNDMGAHAVAAMNKTIVQLSGLSLPGKSEADVRAMLGVTPMIGLNDVSPEVFTIVDAGQLVVNAKGAGTGFLSFWSATRDQPCSGRQVVSPTCSGVFQLSWDFTHAFLWFETQGQ
jgi:hypothetical protein